MEEKEKKTEEAVMERREVQARGVGGDCDGFGSSTGIKLIGLSEKQAG